MARKPHGKTHVKDQTVAGVAAVLLFVAALWFAHQAWFSRGQRPPPPLRWIIPEP